MKRRIIYSDDGTLQDLSINLQNYHSGTNAFTMISAEDNIYIGSKRPFNHIYLKFDGTNINANASVLSVAYWDSGEWRDMVNLLDETSLAGATFAQSGFVTWLTDKSYSWTRENTNYGGNSIAGLTSIELYDLYWCRLSVSADLSADVTLSWAGQKFSNDNDLGAEHPELIRPNFMAAYESGKTNWEEQHVAATEIIVDDLISKELILFEDQLLCKEDLRPCAVKKVAQMIFTGMGEDYEDNRAGAEKEYYTRLNKALPSVDKNSNAREDIGEKCNVGRLYR